jgi:hypothetical protein
MANSCCKECAPAVTQSAGPALVLTRKRRPFAALAKTKLYDSDFLQRLQDGYSSIHLAMPTFRFKRDDAEAVLNYMKSIQEPLKPKQLPQR